MIRIAVCDDQESDLEAAAEAASAYFHTKGIPAEICRFSDPCLLLGLPQSDWDAVILDILMPSASGIDIAREIRRSGRDTGIIFLTSSPDFAVDAFSLNAAHYIVKPFAKHDMADALDRVLGRQKGIILISLGSGAVQSLPVRDIIYIESIAYRRIVHASSGSYPEVKRSLSAFMEELERLTPGQFIQPYRGYIANLDCIRTISPRSLIMQNGDSILIKPGDFRKIRNTFFEWSFRRME